MLQYKPRRKEKSKKNREGGFASERFPATRFRSRGLGPRERKIGRRTASRALLSRGETGVRARTAGNGSARYPVCPTPAAAGQGGGQWRRCPNRGSRVALPAAASYTRCGPTDVRLPAVELIGRCLPPGLGCRPGPTISLVPRERNGYSILPDTNRAQEATEVRAARSRGGPESLQDGRGNHPENAAAMLRSDPERRQPSRGRSAGRCRSATGSDGQTATV